METAIYIPPIEIPTKAMDALSKTDAILKMYHFPYMRYRTDSRGAGSLDLTRTVIKRTEGLPLIFTNTSKVISYATRVGEAEVFSYEPDEENKHWLHEGETELTTEKYINQRLYRFSLLGQNTRLIVYHLDYQRAIGNKEIKQEQKKHNEEQSQFRREWYKEIQEEKIPAILEAHGFQEGRLNTPRLNTP